MTDITNYNDETQELFLRFLVSDPDLFSRCSNIVKPDFFLQKYRPAVELFLSHSEQHNSIPTPEQISAVANVQLETIPNVTPDHHEWFLKEFETFCRHKSLEKAIIESTDLLEKQDYGTVENKIKEASQVGLIKDLGLEDNLINHKGLTPGMLVTLGEQKILNLTDFFASINIVFFSPESLNCMLLQAYPPISNSIGALNDIIV